MDPIDKTLFALADPTRRSIVDLLRVRPHRAGEISEAIGRSPSATSAHLRILLDHGVAREHRSETDNRVRIFELRSEPLAELSDWSAQIADYWDDHLAAFKRFAEKS